MSKKHLKEKNFIPQPQYPGGPKAMSKFVEEQLKYPDEAIKHQIEGTVVVKNPSTQSKFFQNHKHWLSIA
ncbi:MAG: hypothetical protein IPO72_18795 [Saprospiraceae bacterium]|nr:hypothetical protein [Candidatus Vicinibacter affinis]